MTDARLHERAMHHYFRDVRVYKRKEFFAVSADDVRLFFATVDGGIGADDDDDGARQQLWAEALAKAKKRRV